MVAGIRLRSSLSTLPLLSLSHARRALAGYLGRSARMRKKDIREQGSRPLTRPPSVLGVRGSGGRKACLQIYGPHRLDVDSDMPTIASLATSAWQFSRLSRGHNRDRQRDNHDLGSHVVGPARLGLALRMVTLRLGGIAPGSEATPSSAEGGNWRSSVNALAERASRSEHSFCCLHRASYHEP